MGLINEKIVLDFYLDQVDEDNIEFLKGRDIYKKEIKEEILNLKVAEEMNDKIEAAKALWKSLFEAAMSYVDYDKRGYDDLFNFFDEYVNFEELIFASDSFYRDHTLHCLWVYFLGEYLKKNEQYKGRFDDNGVEGILYVNNIINSLKKSKHQSIFRETINIMEKVIKQFNCADSIRCIAALTHDLGYPLKKISKINKSIKNILPYFSIHNYDEFNFEYLDIQQKYISNFIDFLSSDLNINLINYGSGEFIETVVLQDESVIMKILNGEDENLITINDEAIDKATKEQMEELRKAVHTKTNLQKSVSDSFRYSNDFEQYEHGIMSAFLLMKTVTSFNSFHFMYTDESNININNIDYYRIDTIRYIMKAVADHTSSKFQIKNITDFSEFLIFIDEIEEFSRISRANQNRQYVNEFCKTDISIVDDWFQVDFIFDNESLEHLDPEFAFKNRCKKFLSLFRISNIDENLKIRLRCVSKLSCDNNIYALEISKKYANITINGEEQNIPKYLKSKVFYTKEEYMNL